jgi:hypothetical protein
MIVYAGDGGRQLLSAPGEKVVFIFVNLIMAGFIVKHSTSMEKTLYLRVFVFLGSFQKNHSA